MEDLTLSRACTRDLAKEPFDTLPFSRKPLLNCRFPSASDARIVSSCASVKLLFLKRKFATASFLISFSKLDTIASSGVIQKRITKLIRLKLQILQVN